MTEYTKEEEKRFAKEEEKLIKAAPKKEAATPNKKDTEEKDEHVAVVVLEEKPKPFNVMEDSEKTAVMDPQEWMQTKTIARTFFNSSALPDHYKNEHQVVMVIQAGKEIGLSPVEAINGLLMIKGHITAWGKTLTKILRSNGWSIEFKEASDTCTITVERGEESYTETVTFEEAEKSGYTVDSYGKLKFGWKEGMNRRIKLRYMAMNFILKTNIADELGSVNGITEIDDGVVDKKEGPKDQKEELRKKVMSKVKEKKDENN